MTTCATNESVVKQKPAKSANITGYKLFVILPNKKTIKLNIKSNDTLLKLKNKIKMKSNIPVKGQTIVFEGKPLSHNHPLREYKIKNESTVTVIKRVKVTDNTSNDPLAKLLLKHNLYEDLYKILSDNSFDLKMLKHDIAQNQIDDICLNLQFNLKQKVKFRKLMGTIAMNRDDNDDRKYNNYNRKYNNLENRKYNKSDGRKYNNSENRKYNNSYNRFESLPKYNLYEMKDDGHYDDSMTVVLIGDSGVGKSSLIRRYVQNVFNKHAVTTIGVDSLICKETLTDDSVMAMIIWDTAGQERYMSMTTKYYKNGDVIIVCFDVSQAVTLQNCSNWIKQIEEYGSDDVIVIFVGCKGDKSEESRKSVEEQAEEIMDKYGKLYCECSAKTGENVRNVFLTAAEMVRRQRQKLRNKWRDEFAPIKVDTQHELHSISCCTQPQWKI